MANKENFMDKYSSPEEFIRAEVIANRGTKNVMDKEDLLNLLATTPDYSDDFEKKTKAEIYDKLLAVMGKELYGFIPAGVSSWAFQMKFGITNYDVRKMAKHGLIKVTGKSEFRQYGRYCIADTYSPFDYFRLTTEEVHTWLAAHSRKKKHTESEAALV